MPMNASRPILRLSVFLVVLLFVAGCGTAAPAAPGGAAEESAPRRIALVTPYMANETTKYVIEQFVANGKAQGWEVTVTDTAGDFNALVSRIDDAVAQDVDAIVLGMGDPAQMTKGLEAAQSAGIPVFGLDAGVAPGVTLNVTSDNTALGNASSEALLASIGSSGPVVMFTHDPHPGVRERAVAAEAAFMAQSDVTVLDKMHIDVPGPVENARRIMEDLLNAYPEPGSIAGVWAGWDEPALGALQAIQAAGRNEIKVVGIDGTPFAQAEIAKGGPFVATVGQDFDGMAAQLTDLISAYFAGEQPTEQLYKIPGTVITQENAVQ